MTSPDQLTLFAEASPANLSVLPGSSAARMMTVTSGRQCLSALNTSGPVGLLAKMFLESSRWRSTVCFLTWKVQDTPAGRSILRLAPSMPRTDGNGYGLWHTPRTVMIEETPENFRQRMNGKRKNDRKGGYPNLAVQVKYATVLWPTPRANKVIPNMSENLALRNKGNLEEAVAKSMFFPTPQASDFRDRGNMNSPCVQRRMEKGKQVNLSMSVSPVSGKLNPTWVEWLMGFPPGWTELEEYPPNPYQKTKKAGHAHRLKALGNAVVSQIPEAFGRAIMEIEEIINTNKEK